MQAEFVEPNDPRWVGALAEMPHDVYHLPAYAFLDARHEGGEAVAFLAEEVGHRLLVPLVLRPIDAGLTDGAVLLDATSPYGYPGPLLAGEGRENADAFLSRAITALRAFLRERGVVSAFVRLHPLIPVPEEPLRQAGVVARHGETVLIDLTLPEQEHWRQTRHNHRRHINRAGRQGHRAYMDNSRRAFAVFHEIYQETMSRLGAEHRYYVGGADLIALRDLLGDHLHLCLVDIEGQIAAAGLFTEVGGIVQYHLSGTRDACLPHMPTKLMLHFVRSWAKERGNRVLHLGGGLGGRADTLFAFKAGFSDQRAMFASWRLVVDAATYCHLTARWETSHGAPADGPSGFFPAYRKS